MLRYFLLTPKAKAFASETKVVFHKFARKIQHALFMIVKLKVFGMLYMKGARSDLWQCFRTQILYRKSNCLLYKILKRICQTGVKMNHCIDASRCGRERFCVDAVMDHNRLAYDVIHIHACRASIKTALYILKSELGFFQNRQNMHCETRAHCLCFQLAVILVFYFRYAFISAVWNAVCNRCMKCTYWQTFACALCLFVLKLTAVVKCTALLL